MRFYIVWGTLLLYSIIIYSIDIQVGLVNLESQLQALRAYLKEDSKAQSNLLGPLLDTIRPDGQPMLEAQDGPRKIYQIRVFRQAEWQTCGFHALKNGLYILHALDKAQEQLEANLRPLLSQQVFADLYQSWLQYDPLAQKQGLLPADFYGNGKRLGLIAGVINGTFKNNNLGAYARAISVLSALPIETEPPFFTKKRISDMKLLLDALVPEEMVPFIVFARTWQNKAVSDYTHAFIIGNQSHWALLVAHKVSNNQELIVADSLVGAKGFFDSFKQELDNFFDLLSFEPDIVALEYARRQLSPENVARRIGEILQYKEMFADPAADVDWPEGASVETIFDHLELAITVIETLGLQKLTAYTSPSMGPRVDTKAVIEARFNELQQIIEYYARVKERYRKIGNGTRRLVTAFLTAEPKGLQNRFDVLKERAQKTGIL